MRVLHGYQTRIETCLGSKVANITGVVVGHEEIPGDAPCKVEQPFVIDLGIFVQPPCRDSVRRINEERPILTSRVFSDKFHAVAFNKPNPITYCHDGQDALSQSFWIPP
jgi:hypothetical protein